MSDNNSCKYCQEGAVIGYDGAGDAISIEQDDKNSALESDSWGFLIKYCPMCGRELNHE